MSAAAALAKMSGIGEPSRGSFPRFICHTYLTPDAYERTVLTWMPRLSSLRMKVVSAKAAVCHEWGTKGVPVREAKVVNAAHAEP